MKKNKLISIIAIVLMTVVITEPLNASATVSASVGQAVQECNEETSASEQFAEAINGESLVYSIKSLNDQNSLNFTYDNNCNRLTKSNDKGTTYYIYDENNKLVEERNSEKTIKYTLDEEKNLIGIEVDGNKYTYVFDSKNDNVTAIKDEAGNIVAKYEYDEKNNTRILGKNEKGEWIDKSEDDSFIGSINPYRFAGFYFDKETGYYYYGGCYYNAETGKYYLDNNATNSKISIKPSSRLSVKSSAVSKKDIDTQANNLIKNKKVGNAINDTSSTWYSKLSNIDLLARLIYAENTSNLTDQKAVSWVLINRYNANKSYLGGKNLRDIATKKGQFSSIGGAPKNARCPNTSSQGWSNAVWLACAITKTQDRTTYATLTPKPKGIDKQCYFWGISLFSSKATASNGAISLNGKKLKNVAIAGVANNITSMKTITDNKSKSYNVFYEFASENLL